MSLVVEFFSTDEVIENENGLAYKRHSNLTAAINHARDYTGRDHNGQVIQDKHTGNWLGNLAYLVIIDLLTSCFINPTGKGNKKDFIAFLTREGLADDDAGTIYELRCSFAHDFGLVNIGSGGTPTTKFTVSPTGPMITPPTTPWDGTYNTLTASTTTYINLRKVSDEVERIVKELKAKANAGTLTTHLSPDEFRTRFFFRVGPFEPDVAPGCLSRILKFRA